MRAGGWLGVVLLAGTATILASDRRPGRLGGGLADQLATLPDNTALDLGEYECVTYAGDQSCRRVVEYSGFTYDPLGKRMLMFGGGHSTTFRDDVDVFDLATLGWQSAYLTTLCAEMSPPNFDPVDGKWISTGHPTSRHSYDLLVVAASTDELLLLTGGDGPGSQCTGFDTGGGKVAHYALGSSPAWTFGGSVAWAESSPQDFYPAAELDPVSGRVVVVGTYGLSTYDPVSRIAERHVVDAVEERGYANNLVYFPPNQRMYLIARGDPTRVFEVTLVRFDWSASTIVELTGVTGTVPDSVESGWAYDAANQLIGGGVRNGRFYAFDPVARHWQERVMAVVSTAVSEVGSLAYHALDYAPLDNVFVFLSDAGGGGADRTWAYRFAGAALFADGFESGDLSAW